MKNTHKSFDGLIVFAFFSIVTLMSMIIIPLVMKQSSNIVKNKVKENNFITINGDEKIRVYLSKEDKVVEIPIEDYVKSVTSSEMPISFDDEALKAQAIAARTYAISKKLRPYMPDKGADVCDTVSCQVYMTKEKRIEAWGEKGEENWKKISKLVDETKGIVLSYNNELVKYPQFFSTSSGNTENSIDVFSSDVPYLVSTESKGEEVAPKFISEFKFTLTEFIDKLNSKYNDLKLTKDKIKEAINILSRSDAGGIKQINIGSLDIKGSEFRLLLGLSSTNFEFEINGDEIIFKCKGYGHGVGMSQWGANIMSKEGNEYDKILKHYYTGVELSKLKFTK